MKIVKLLNFINLFKLNLVESFALKKSIKNLSSEIHGECLDAGCGTKPYESLFRNCTKYIGLEVSTDIALSSFEPDFFYDGNIFPFEDKSFDSVVSFEVLEHVKNPDQYISEILRVLKPEGLLMLSVPFTWIEHEKPYDYRRFTQIGIENYLISNGFDIKSSKKTTGPIYTTFINLILVLRARLRKYISYLGDLLLLPLTILCHSIGFIELLLKLDGDSYTSTIVLAGVKKFSEE